MSAQPGVALRVLAARTLDAVLHRGRSLKAELAQALPQLADSRDRALLEAIAFTALRGRARYDTALAAWMSKPLPRRDGELRALLHAGFAQLDLRLPAHAAVDATVGAARALGRAHQAGLTNALLRRALRDGLPDADPAAAWPAWLLARLRRDWPQHADAIVAASAQPAPLWLRANVRRTSRDALLAQLQATGLAVAEGPLAEASIRIDEPLAVATLPGFATGDFSVQDLSAQLVADALAPAPGASVLDACAAPGGKAAHLLERDPSLRLTALDIDATRLGKVRDNFARLGVGGTAVLRVADAADAQTLRHGEHFEAILLDAPCTATGVVRRQPDVLLHRRESDLPPLVATQARLLDACWSQLAPGGVLLYATCSILADENAQQVEAFLARTPDARAEPLDARFGHPSGGGRQRFPGEDDADGFFYARLRKATA